MDQDSKISSAQKDSVNFPTEAGKHGTNAESNRSMLPDINDSRGPDDTTDTLAELARQNVAPFLAKYHPRQYAPLRSEDGTPEIPRPVNAGYCYRHQPDSKCRRQADEQSMRQLQRVSSSLVPRGVGLFISQHPVPCDGGIRDAADLGGNLLTPILGTRNPSTE